MPDTADVIAALQAAPLTRDLEADSRGELARLLARGHFADGQALWHTDEDGDSMALIVSGRLRVSLDLPGGSVVEITKLGPGDVIGELPLLDGGRRSASVEAEGDVDLLFLSRADFGALVSRCHPSSFALKRHIAGVECARLRRQLSALAVSLPGTHAGTPATGLDALEPAERPSERYVERLAVFHGVAASTFSELLDLGRVVRCASGAKLVAEGRDSPALYLTVNGAIEQSLVRDVARMRISLSGPGRAFGYEGIIDSLPAPLTAVARERSVLLAVPRQAFMAMFEGQRPETHGFLDLVQRDLSMTLRQALRPQARLAMSL